MIRKALFFVFYFLSGNFVFAQNQEIDSLKKALQYAKHDTNKIKTLQLLGAELYWSGDSKTALLITNESKELSKELQFKPGLGKAYLLLGRLSIDQNNYSLALKLLDSTRSIREELQDHLGLAEVYIAFSQVYHMEDNYLQSLAYLLKAEKIYDAQNNSSKLIYLYSLYGTVYTDYGHYEEAIQYLIKARNAYREKKKFSYLSSVLTVLAMAYLESGNHPKALSSIREAITISKQTGVEIDPNTNLYLAKIYVRIGEELESENNYIKARDTFNLALQVMPKTLERFEKADDYLGRVNSYITLGRIYLGLNDFRNAKYFLQKCLTLSLQTKNLFETRDSYRHLSKMYSKTGQVSEAFENYQKYILFRDSIVNQTNTKEIAQMQMQYAFDKEEASAKALQEKKDLLIKKELERQRQVRNSFIGGFLVILFFAAVFLNQRNKIRKSKKLSDELLLNILPSEVAEELKQKGSAEAKSFGEVTVMFTDFKNFTKISENLSPAALIGEIDTFFKAFDNIITAHNIEKIKTIGDSYMCVGGLPVTNKTHAGDVVSAAIEIQEFVQNYFEKKTKEGKEAFEIRIGIHTGPVVAGIVGSKKFAYDIWGDTVNLASRMESSGEAGKINISGSTYNLVKDKFHCTFRGKIKAKNKGEIDMYFVESIL